MERSLLIILIFAAISVVNCAGKASVFAYEDNCHYVSNCACYNLNDGFFTCTTYPDFNGIASFNDPIPKGSYQITNVTLTFKGDAYCHLSGEAAFFYLNVKLNGVSLNPLRSAKRYGCNCECDTISNSTVFFSGISNYNFQGKNYITTTPESGTAACFQGFNVSLTYINATNSPNRSPSPLNLPSHTVSLTRSISRSRSITLTATFTRSPSPSKSQSLSKTPKASRSISPTSSPRAFVCCVYVNSNTGYYDITCAKSCFSQVGYTLLTQYPTDDCSVCF